MTTLMHAPPLKQIELSLGRFCSQTAFLEYRQMGGWLKGIPLFKFIYNETEPALHTTKQWLFRGFRQRLLCHEF